MRTLLWLSVGALALCLSSPARARPAMSVKEVRTVFDAGGRGDHVFNSRLRAQMRDLGLRFVHSRGQADAVLRSSGQGTDADGFRGRATLRSPGGQTLWSAKVERAPRSRAMAFDSLAAKLRAARK